MTKSINELITFLITHKTVAELEAEQQKIQEAIKEADSETQLNIFKYYNGLFAAAILSKKF